MFMIIGNGDLRKIFRRMNFKQLLLSANKSSLGKVMNFRIIIIIMLN